MKTTYDKNVDAAYIYILDKIEPGSAKKTYLCDPLEIGGMINLDFDKDGKLLGVEILDASKFLPQSVLEKADKPPIRRAQ